ncbi:MAG: CAP domain-containing protein [Actinomycetota bacterium]
MAKRLLVYIATLFMAVSLGALGALAAQAAPGLTAEEQGFFSGVNQARAAKGVHALVVADDLVEVARRHSAEMAAKGTIYHNPNLATDVSNWQVVGENVGMGPTVESINQAFIDSPKHYANYVDTAYTQLGVGVVIDSDGRIFVTQVFRQPASAPAPVAKPAAQPPVAPKPAAKTTTSAPAPAAPKVAAKAAVPVASAPVAKPAPTAEAPKAAPSPRLAMVLQRLGDLDRAADRALTSTVPVNTLAFGALWTSLLTVVRGKRGGLV